MFGMERLYMVIIHKWKLGPGFWGRRECYLCLCNWDTLQFSAL